MEEKLLKAYQDPSPTGSIRLLSTSWLKSKIESWRDRIIGIDCGRTILGRSVTRPYGQDQAAVNRLYDRYRCVCSKKSSRVGSQQGATAKVIQQFQVYTNAHPLLIIHPE